MKELFDTDPEREPTLACLPFADTAHMGRMSGDEKAAAAAEGARTVPPREHGGNCDIKDLTRGAKVYFPFTWMVRACPWVICTSVRAMVKLLSVVPLKWPAGFTCV